MKKKKLAVLMTFLMLSLAPAPVFATSLDDVVTQNSDSDSSADSGDSSVINGTLNEDLGIGDDGTVGGLIDKNANQSKATEATNKAASIIYKISGEATRLLIILIAAALPVSILIDYGYILVPLLRTQEKAHGQQGQGNGYGNSSYGGYGGSYAGGYSNSGYGGSSYGGGAQVAQDERTKFIGLPVSKEAIAIANTQDSAITKLAEYTKQSTVKTIFGVAFIVLIATGLLSKLGLLLGGKIGEAIVGAIGAI